MASVPFVKETARADGSLPFPGATPRQGPAPSRNPAAMQFPVQFVVMVAGFHWWPGYNISMEMNLLWEDIELT